MEITIATFHIEVFFRSHLVLTSYMDTITSVRCLLSLLLLNITWNAGLEFH